MSQFKYNGARPTAYAGKINEEFTSVVVQPGDVLELPPLPNSQWSLMTKKQAPEPTPEPTPESEQ